MINAEMQAETREIIDNLLKDGSQPNALYIIEHHIFHDNFEKLEKIAVELFKLGYEVADAEEFEENGKIYYTFDALSEEKLDPAIIDRQQQEILPIIEKFDGVYDGWGTYFEDGSEEEDGLSYFPDNE